MGNMKVQNINVYSNVFKLCSELIPQSLERIFLSFLVVFSQMMFSTHNKAKIWIRLELKERTTRCGRY